MEEKCSNCIYYQDISEDDYCCIAEYQKAPFGYLGCCNYPNAYVKGVKASGAVKYNSYCGCFKGISYITSIDDYYGLY